LFSPEERVLYCPDCGKINKEMAKFCTKCGCRLTESLLTKELPSASKDITPGTILDHRYKIIRIIERGGMGAVYKAEDLRLNIICALKEMRENFEREEHRKYAIERFKDEALILSKLRHSNIPRVSDYFIENNRYFIVMDFIEGDTLFKVLNSRPNKRLDEAEVVNWTLQICDVLEYLHGQSPPVIYRDLKPANVMITKDNKVMLIDFGIARIFKPKSRGTMIGTQGYAPPEQYRGSVEPRSDIYSLGATLHHLVTGKDPQKDAPFSFSPIKELRPEITAIFAGMVEKCLKFKIAERFSNAGELKDYINNRILKQSDEHDEQTKNEPEKPVKNIDSEENLKVKKDNAAIAFELENLLISIESDSAPVETNIDPDNLENAGAISRSDLNSVDKKKMSASEKNKFKSLTPDVKKPDHKHEEVSSEISVSLDDSVLSDIQKESPTPDLEKPGSEKKDAKQKKSTRKSFIEISDVTRESQLFDQLLSDKSKDSSMKEHEDTIKGKPAFPFGPVEINIPRRENMLRKIPQIKRESTKLKSLRKSSEKEKTQVAFDKIEESAGSVEITGDILQDGKDNIFDKPDGGIETYPARVDSVGNKDKNLESGSGEISECEHSVDSGEFGEDAANSGSENRDSGSMYFLQNEETIASDTLQQKGSGVDLEAVKSTDNSNYITNLDLTTKSGRIELLAMTGNMPAGWETFSDNYDETYQHLSIDEEVEKLRWTMFRGNRGRTGKNNNASDQCTGNLKWRFKTNGRINSSPILDRDENIYFGSDDGCFYALTSEGKEKWIFAVDDIISATPLLINKRGIYFGSENGCFYCLSFSGREVWRLSTNSPIKSSANVDSEGRIYFGCTDGRVFAVSIDGQTLWTADLRDYINSSPVLNPYGTLYIGSCNNSLYAISSTGKILGKTETDGPVESSPAIDDAGNIYFGSGDQYFYALHDSGKVKWKFKSKDKITSSPAVDKNLGIFFGSQDTYLYNLSFDGKLRWRIKTDHWIRSSPALDIKGNIYIGSDDFSCHKFSPQGDRIWKFKTNAAVTSSPCISDNSVIYFGSNDGWLYALK
jgi:serine/threonine protein kinase